MANNLAIGPNGVVAKSTITFADAGVTSVNTAIIYEVGSPTKSYVPGRALNGITGFTEGKGYYLVMLAAVDWSAFLIPPIPSGTGNVTPAAPTAGVIDDTANTFNWTNSTGLTALTDYEFTLNGGTSYANVTEKPIVVGNIAKAAGQVGVRVKAATGRNVSATLYNATAFTVASGAGTIMYEDTFNAADDSDIDGRIPTTQTAGTEAWQKVVGNLGKMQIVSNGLTGNTDGSAPADYKSKYFINHPVRNADLRYTIKSLTNPSTGAGFALWAMYAYTNEDNFFQTNLVNGETYKKVATVVTQLYAGSGVSAPGDVVRCSLNGTSLKIYRGATLLQDITVSATELSGTGHGILCDGVLSTADALDQFTSLTV